MRWPSGTYSVFDGRHDDGADGGQVGGGPAAGAEGSSVFAEGHVSGAGMQQRLVVLHNGDAVGFLSCQPVHSPAELLPLKGFRRWDPAWPVSRPLERQPATGLPGDYPDQTFTDKYDELPIRS